MEFRKLFKKAIEGTKKIVDRVSKEIKWRNKVGEAKRELLSRFTLQQLRRIAASKGISLVYKDPITGARKRLVTKPDIVRRLAARLRFKEIVNLAKKYGIAYFDVVQELERFRQELFEEERVERSEKEILEDIYRAEEQEDEGLRDEYSEIIKLIEEFRPVGVSREDDLKYQLYQWLSARLGMDAVRLEHPFEHGKVDILVRDSIAIELKIASNRQQLKNLVGEVATDKEYFGSVIAVIFDVGKNVGLEFFVNQLKALGAITIVIPIQIRKRGRKREIIIKQGGRRIIIK